MNGMNGSKVLVPNHAMEVSELTQELKVFRLNMEVMNVQGHVIGRLAAMNKNAQVEYF